MVRPPAFESGDDVMAQSCEASINKVRLVCINTMIFPCGWDLNLRSWAYLLWLFPFLVPLGVIRVIFSMHASTHRVELGGGQNNSGVRLSICRVTNSTTRSRVSWCSRSFATARRHPPRHRWAYIGRFGTFFRLLVLHLALGLWRKMPSGWRRESGWDIYTLTNEVVILY